MSFDRVEKGEIGETGPRKFRKKPVVIQAMLWTGRNIWEMTHFAGHAAKVKSEGDRNALVIETIEGTMIGETGDWIICGVKGEFYPIKDNIFRETYEREDGSAI